MAEPTGKAPQPAQLRRTTAVTGDDAWNIR